MQALDTPADVHRQFQYSFQDLEGTGKAANILQKEAPHGALCQLQPAIKERDKFKYLYEKAFKERDKEKKEKEKTLRELEAFQFDLHASPQVQSEVDKLTAKVQISIQFGSFSLSFLISPVGPPFVAIISSLLTACFTAMLQQS